jgi:hypothetical protein
MKHGAMLFTLWWNSTFSTLRLFHILNRLLTVSCRAATFFAHTNLSWIVGKRVHLHFFDVEAENRQVAIDARGKWPIHPNNLTRKATANGVDFW